MSRLIYDDGKLRDCEHNYALLGYVGTWWHFYSYKRVIRNRTAWGKWLDAVTSVLVGTLLILLIPILPFLLSYLRVREARKTVAKLYDTRAYRQLNSFKTCKRLEREVILNDE